MKTAVQFGAGNIGRGFMGQLFWEAGYRIIFVDANKSLSELLNRSKKYPLRILDAYSRKEINMVIDGVEALATDEPGKIAAAVAGADVIGTAVGVKNLKSVARLIAKGIARRFRGNGLGLDIYLCENIYGAADLLSGYVEELLDAPTRAWAHEHIGFVGTSVARMVPAAGEHFGAADPLLVVADSHHELAYDAHAVRAEVPLIRGLRAVGNIRAELERKLFTHNLGHAALAYLGYLKGYSYVHEGFADEWLNSVFEGALDETTEALLRRYPEDLDPGEHRGTRKDVRVRFGNPMVMDTVVRVARDPIRKLGPQDRLIGSANLCLSQQVFPKKIAYICAAVLRYDFQADPDAVCLQEMIRQIGVEKTLKRISEVDPVSKLGQQIVTSYFDLSRDGTAPNRRLH